MDRITPSGWLALAAIAVVASLWYALRQRQAAGKSGKQHLHHDCAKLLKRVQVLQDDLRVLESELHIRQTMNEVLEKKHGPDYRPKDQVEAERAAELERMRVLRAQLAEADDAYQACVNGTRS